jgi:hypothetical protein
MNFCRDHSARQLYIESQSLSGHSAVASTNVTLCFGKPICIPCHDEYQYSSVSELEEMVHMGEIFPWVACVCHKSLACLDCYSESRLLKIQLCNECRGSRDAQVRCECKECTYYEHKDCEREYLHRTGKLSLYHDTDVLKLYADTVDWSQTGLLEDVGVEPTSKLHESMCQFLKLGEAHQSSIMLQIYNDLLVQDSSTIWSLNEKRDLPRPQRLTSAFDKREFFAQNGIPPGNSLAVLTAKLLEYGNVGLNQLADALTEMKESVAFQWLNQNTLVRKVSKWSEGLAKGFVDCDFICRLSFEVYP